MARPRRESNATIAGTTWWAFPSLFYLVFFFLIPVLFMFRYSFYRYIPGMMAVPDFTFDTYREFFTDPYFRKLILDSFILALELCCCTTVIGYPLAWFLARSKSRIKPLISGIVLLPLLVSVVVTTFGWMYVISDNGLINSLLMKLNLIDKPFRMLFSRRGVLIVLTQAELPFMIMSIRNVLTTVDRNLEDAAQTLGATPTRTFLSVTLPLSLPGIAAGFFLNFIGAISAFVTPALIGGGKFHTIASQIYRQMTVSNNWTLGAVMSFTLLLVTSVIIFFYNRLMDSKYLSGGRKI